MRQALAVVQTAMQQQAAGKLPGAHILGVHLEGPFLSPERPGAMPPAALLPPTLAAYQTLVQGYESVIRQVTLAPELPGGAGTWRSSGGARYPGAGRAHRC